MRIAIAAAALSATIAAPAVAACDPGEREIRFDHVGPAAGNAVGEGAQTLAWLVNDRLDGRACMTVTPGAANHTEATVTDALREGVFEMGAVGTGYLGEISPRFLVFDLPFLFDNIAAVLDFQHSGTGEDLLHEARGEGLEGLAFWLDGFKQMGATRPVSAPADLSDLRMVASGSEVGRAAIEAMSAEPVAADEGAAALIGAGRAEGQAASWSGILSGGAHRQMAAMTETNHSITEYVLMTSTAFWDSLDPALRADLEQVIAEVAHERNRLAFELNEAAKFRMQSSGARIIELTEAERLAFKRAMQTVWFGFGGEIGFDQISTALHANRTN